MSGLKPFEITQFYRRLHDRGLNVGVLAERLGRSSGTVSRVINGSRRRGPLWKRLARHLTDDEIRLLDVAKSSSWNTRRIARRPQWNSDLAAKIAERATEREKAAN